MNQPINQPKIANDSYQEELNACINSELFETVRAKLIGLRAEEILRFDKILMPKTTVYSNNCTRIIVARVKEINPGFSDSFTLTDSVEPSFANSLGNPKTFEREFERELGEYIDSFNGEISPEVEQRIMFLKKFFQRVKARMDQLSAESLDQSIDNANSEMEEKGWHENNAFAAASAEFGLTPEPGEESNNLSTLIYEATGLSLKEKLKPIQELKIRESSFLKQMFPAILERAHQFGVDDAFSLDGLAQSFRACFPEIKDLDNFQTEQLAILEQKEKVRTQALISTLQISDPDFLEESEIYKNCQTLETKNFYLLRIKELCPDYYSTLEHE